MLGRFDVRDPIRYIDGSNLYEYELSNSANTLDSMGTATGPGIIWQKHNAFTNPVGACLARGGKWGTPANNIYGGSVYNCVQAFVENVWNSLCLGGAGAYIGGAVGGGPGALIGYVLPFTTGYGVCNTPGCSLDQKPF